jgi:hypothetical protein
MDIIWHRVLFGIIRVQETFDKKLRAEKTAGSPQSICSLAQLVHFGFRVSEHFLFGLIWDYKTLGDFPGTPNKLWNLD